MAGSSMSASFGKRALAKLGRQLGTDLPEAIKAELRAAMPIIGRQFQAEARLLVPVRTGALRDAIVYQVDSGGLAVNLFVDGRKLANIDRNAGWANRAIWIEFGTVKMPARPYFFAAWRSKKRAFRARLRRAAKKGARSIA